MTAGGDRAGGTLKTSAHALRATVTAPGKFMPYSR
jgi:hypothetical protein